LSCTLLYKLREGKIRKGKEESRELYFTVVGKAPYPERSKRKDPVAFVELGEKEGIK